ncbi:PREDICTED: uncharacterized protein LOC108687074 [Atta colombica]|uniref:uncharacterized protein LOC108687074 n=1 Tax=Atta colombica TaxID=520822 RepID=UPI00084C438A|nr:PREDICTED: uncharacterized protein LOC108687074 [Atta colombica]
MRASWSVVAVLEVTNRESSYHRKRDKHVNLLYVKNPQDDNVEHFCVDERFALIKDLFRLVRSQITRSKNKKYFCDRYLYYFNTNEKLQSHLVDCGKMNDCAIRLPSKNDKWLSFNNHCRKERVLFVSTPI